MSLPYKSMFRILCVIRNIFEAIFSVLKPGGHLLIGDHVGSWGLYKQIRLVSVVPLGCCPNVMIRLMEDVGFEDLDIAWRKDAFFVAGGRKPDDN